MHAGRYDELRTKPAANAAARALLVCAAVALGLMILAVARAQQPPPVLTVPTGLPPARPQPQPTPASIQAALSAIQAASGGQPAVPAAAPEALPRPNPFVVQAGAPVAPAASGVPAAPTPPASGQGLLLPFNPARGGNNVSVNDDHDGLVSLMVRDGSLRQVVAMIAETQKLNIVFAGPNDATVSASFDRQPWQTVLDSLLSASGYTWTTRGPVIFVAPMDVADFMPPDAGGQQVEFFELDFASAVDVDQAIKGMLSPSGKSWITEADPADNRKTKEAIAVVDYPQYIGRIQQYIGQADQPPRQVFIQAHILQVELTDDCRNGVNFKHIIGMSGADVTLKSVGFANPAATSAFLVDENGTGLDGLIELLQNTTDAKTLASPELHVVSGETSKMQIGQNLPYKVTTTTQTATLESVQMLNVGVVLEVTPRVTRDGRVIMRIKPKVSSGAISPDTGLPSEKTSQLETDVLMCSGQGMVLGGLIDETDSNIQSKLPFFGNIPYVGVLFQKRQVVKSRKETIVTLRPYVLPYTPILGERLAEKVYRTEQPLTQGAISSYPRPYEPHMKDTFDHFNAKHASYVVGESEFRPPADGELMLLPPVDSPLGDAVEELPPGVEPGATRSAIPAPSAAEPPLE